VSRGQSLAPEDNHTIAPTIESCTISALTIQEAEGDAMSDAKVDVVVRVSMRGAAFREKGGKLHEHSD
jgi:hypothetical protein